MEGGVFADLDPLIADRQRSGTRLADAAALGESAAVGRGGGPETFHTAMWSVDDVVSKFRAAFEEASFRSLLASLTFVNDEEWISAFPDTVVTDRPQAASEFLADVPLPSGFDTASLEVGPAEDWYQVGAHVIGPSPAPGSSNGAQPQRPRTSRRSTKRHLL